MIQSCSHLNDYLKNQFDFEDTKTISKNLEKIFFYMKIMREMHKFMSQLENLICGDCTSDKQLNLHVCGICLYIGCFKTHMNLHYLKEKHEVAVNLHFGAFYCLICKDYQYNEISEDLFSNFFIKNKFLRFGTFTDWESSNLNLKVISNSMSRKYKAIQLNRSTTIGLRGLLNLGNTCFMNCILQALAHTPILRDYFLSDLHVCKNLISKKNENSKPNRNCLYNNNNKKNNNLKSDCLVCELSELYQELYSGNRTPYIPFNLLHLIWTQVKHLAGYEQQDAHEFFIATLNGIHKNCVENGDCAHVLKDLSNNNSCNCIIDRIFTGSLQSDLTCTNCQNVSTKEEPFWDISLDLGRNNSLIYRMVYDNTQTDTSVCSLEDCLRRFTQPETLKSFNCSFCGNIHDSTKQLTFKKLPVVACFHLKRFEHSLKLHKKISTHIAFPEKLDISPFMSSKMNSFNENISIVDQKNQYNLFAVVNHQGTIEAGHYTCFIRWTKDEWVKCDDHIVSKASIEEVLNSEGYLLFYHKIWLDYNQ